MSISPRLFRCIFPNAAQRCILCCARVQPTGPKRIRHSHAPPIHASKRGVVHFSSNEPSTNTAPHQQRNDVVVCVNNVWIIQTFELHVQQCFFIADLVLHKHNQPCYGPWGDTQNHPHHSKRRLIRFPSSSRIPHLPIDNIRLHRIHAVKQSGLHAGPNPCRGPSFCLEPTNQNLSISMACMDPPATPCTDVLPPHLTPSFSEARVALVGKDKTISYGYE